MNGERTGKKIKKTPKRNAKFKNYVRAINVRRKREEIIAVDK